ncbi:MAG: hypothetical protein ACE5J2_00445 [Nitrososphaerales archaeon]
MKAILGAGIVVAAVLVAAAVAIAINEQQAEAAKMSRRFVAQTTAISDTDPVPGHSGHQLVLVVPPREDGQIWSGTITWTSSIPVDVVILHGYDQSMEIDERGEPLIAPSPFGDGAIAITLVKPDSGSAVPSGSLSFTGSALAFHTTDGTPFTVTYTVDALSKKPNQ